jgi:hypothetical protein
VDAVLALSSAVVALGLVVGVWVLADHWHTAVKGQVNIGRLDDAWVPAWFANVGIPAGLLWLVFLWGWWEWREPRRPSRNPSLPKALQSEDDEPD